MVLRNNYDNINIIISKNKIIYKNYREIIEKDFDISLDSIRNQIKQMGDICPYDRNNNRLYYSFKLENNNIPYTNYIYYLLFFKNLKIPTLNEFVDEYLFTYCDFDNNGLYRVKPFFDDSNLFFTKEQITGRIYREYNFFNRNIELFFQINEYDDIIIEYDFHEDLNGVNFNIIYEKESFGLMAFIQNGAFEKFEEMKDSLKYEHNEFNTINIFARFDENEGNNCESYNGVYLYSPIFVAQIYFEIIKRTENKTSAN